MTGFQYFLIALYFLSIITTIAMVDRKRTPITSKEALVAVVINLILIYGIIHWI